MDYVQLFLLAITTLLWICEAILIYLLINYGNCEIL